MKQRKNFSEKSSGCAHFSGVLAMRICLMHLMFCTYSAFVIAAVRMTLSMIDAVVNHIE